jgi:hypothetical protein
MKQFLVSTESGRSEFINAHDVPAVRIGEWR